jgi:hypothetical protein
MHHTMSIHNHLHITPSLPITTCTPHQAYLQLTAHHTKPTHNHPHTTPSPPTTNYTPHQAYLQLTTHPTMSTCNKPYFTPYLLTTNYTLHQAYPQPTMHHTMSTYNQPHSTPSLPAHTNRFGQKCICSSAVFTMVHETSETDHNSSSNPKSTESKTYLTCHFQK